MAPQMPFQKSSQSSQTAAKQLTQFFLPRSNITQNNSSNIIQLVQGSFTNTKVSSIFNVAFSFSASSIAYWCFWQFSTTFLSFVQFWKLFESILDLSTMLFMCTPSLISSINSNPWLQCLQFLPQWFWRQNDVWQWQNQLNITTLFKVL